MVTTMQDRARRRGPEITGGTNQNAAFNKRAMHGGSGSPRDVTMGKDTSRDATNVIGGTEVSMKPVSPSANANSRNGG